jgi:hypothetical protein
MYKPYPLLEYNTVSTNDYCVSILTRDTLYNKYLFVISVDEPEVILIHPFSKKYKHNNMVNNGDVICAGEITIHKDKVTIINECEQYLPEYTSLHYAEQLLLKMGYTNIEKFYVMHYIQHLNDLKKKYVTPELWDKYGIY